MSKDFWKTGIKFVGTLLRAYLTLLYVWTIYVPIGVITAGVAAAAMYPISVEFVKVLKETLEFLDINFKDIYNMGMLTKIYYKVKESYYG